MNKQAKLYPLRSICSLLILLLIAPAGYGATPYRNVLTNSDKQTNSKPAATERQLLQSYCQAVKEADRTGGLNAVSEIRYKRKNPKVAFWLGFVPGFAIHGLGHIYIGKYWAAGSLFVIEVVSLGAFALGALASMGENSGPHADRDADRLAGVAFVLFFGSWIYDFAAAPRKAEKLNARYKYTIYPDINSQRVTVNLAVSW